ncbi:protein of unknown function [Rhodovastum atsumiense]|nr:protein of unknown function [Rhodovastum atsumiense]
MSGLPASAFLLTSEIVIIYLFFFKYSVAPSETIRWGLWCILPNKPIEIDKNIKYI